MRETAFSRLQFLFAYTWNFIFIYTLKVSKSRIIWNGYFVWEVWRWDALERTYQRKGFANPHSCWSQANTTVIMWSIQLTLCGCRSIRHNIVLCHILLLSNISPDYQKGPEPKATSLHISSSCTTYTISSTGLSSLGRWGQLVLNPTS